jgi:hypothetical protein
MASWAFLVIKTSFNQIKIHTTVVYTTICLRKFFVVRIEIGGILDRNSTNMKHIDYFHVCRTTCDYEGNKLR